MRLIQQWWGSEGLSEESNPYQHIFELPSQDIKSPFNCLVDGELQLAYTGVIAIPRSVSEDRTFDKAMTPTLINNVARIFANHVTGLCLYNK